MAQTSITMRIDENLKKQAEELFAEFGMNMTTALTVFIKAAVRQGKIPFEISVDIPNAETIEAMKEADRIIHDDSVQGFCDVDEMMKEIIG